MKFVLIMLALTVNLANLAMPLGAQALTVASPAKIIIDTDIGDDIDDAFAVTLALASPEVKVIGFTTAFGDTLLRAKLLDRLLAETGHGDIPVAVGMSTADPAPFSQRHYAEAHVNTRPHESAMAFLQREIAKAPGEITLVAIGPMGNLGALIEKDPATFRKLKQVVLMGGSIDRGYSDRGYGGLGYSPASKPDAEWNLANDPTSAQKLFASGVPLYVLPLDSTQLKLDEVKRAALFQQGNASTDALTLLYAQWGQQTPTLFDPLTIAWLLQPSLCPMQPIRLGVDAKGYTRRENGPPNAQVCLRSNEEAFFRLLMPRLLGSGITVP